MKSKDDFQWYHQIIFPDGTKTRRDEDVPIHVWSMMREVRGQLNYDCKRVLDIASWDGMWAFEAEQLGASQVIATDVISMMSPRSDIAFALAKFLYVRERLSSRVLPFYNVSVHRITDLLALMPRFDIVQNLGLLYHLENPWHAVKQCRRMLVDGGHMFLETAFEDTPSGASMRMNRGVGTFYKSDTASYWAPTLECLRELLAACYFELKGHDIATVPVNSTVHRIALIAEAVPIPVNAVEFNNDYRTGFPL